MSTQPTSIRIRFKAIEIGGAVINVENLVWEERVFVKDAYRQPTPETRTGHGCEGSIARIPTVETDRLCIGCQHSVTGSCDAHKWIRATAGAEAVANRQRGDTEVWQIRQPKKK